MHWVVSDIRDPMQNRSSPDNAIKLSRTICLTSDSVSFKAYSTIMLTLWGKPLRLGW